MDQKQVGSIKRAGLQNALTFIQKLYENGRTPRGDALENVQNMCKTDHGPYPRKPVEEEIRTMKRIIANCDHRIPIPLLRFLGACVSGDAAAYYGRLNEAERAELDAQGKSFGMTAWFYRHLIDVLPEEKRTACRRIYQARQVKAMINARELKRLYCVLTSHGLRFVPIKGADLACRLYPDMALRAFCDWDIWFHPDDCEQALAVLAGDGWKQLTHSTEDPATIIRSDRTHHFPARVRGKFCVEPHFTLANFEGIAPHEMWRRTLEYPDGDGQRVLSPEMNLLMLTRHAASKSYFHAHLPKLLTDAAMVIRNEHVNFAELRTLAKSWDLPYPGDLLAAFPEFFPSNVIAEFGADSKRAAVFRQLFETRGKLEKQETPSLLLCRFEIRGQIVGGVMKRIRAHTPAKMRLIYHLPEHGAWRNVLSAYVSWFWTRNWKTRDWIWRNPVLREYARTVETAESVQNS